MHNSPYEPMTSRVFVSNCGEWNTRSDADVTSRQQTAMMTIGYWYDARNCWIKSPSRFNCSALRRMFSKLCWTVRAAAAAGCSLKNSCAYHHYNFMVQMAGSWLVLQHTHNVLPVEWQSYNRQRRNIHCVLEDFKMLQQNVLASSANITKGGVHRCPWNNSRSLCKHSSGWISYDNYIHMTQTCAKICT